MLRSLVLILLVLLTLGLWACEDAPKTSDEDIQTLEVEKLRTMLAGTKKKDRTILVDVRPAAQFAQGYIPGAINIPLPNLLAGDARLGDATNIVVYGKDALDMLPPAAAKRLLALGYQGVYAYRGGLEQWKKLGGRVQSLE